MKSYIIKRLFSLIFVLLGVTFLTFLVTDLAPSDSAEMYYLSRGMTPSSETLETTRKEMGLDKPVIERYVHWLDEAMHGNLGESYHYGNSVIEQMSRKLPNTLKLAFLSLSIVVVISIPLGIFTAIYQNRAIDYFIRFLTFFSISIPNFWLGLLLIYIFSVKLGIFNVISGTDLKGMILPMITLSLPLMGSYIRQIRTAILEELSKDYVVGAVSRGLSQWDIIVKHVLPNAFSSIVTLLGLSIGHLLGGTAIVETIFSYQGIGSMIVEAIRVRDYPIIQGYVVWMAIIYVFVNLIVDLLCFMMNPKMRLSKGERL
ncbi:nickel ABC transporter permease [Beduini massiliensis]|uniref:nickel ABC transporter permease n=1 Tax=Beduini massiliensis TaxID=1585974 RepID=UPI00059A834B|nr:nickel ABC transporter permease [Beduini massiliensis]